MDNDQREGRDWPDAEADADAGAVRHRLAAVLQVCRQSRTLSEAGRLLFQASRTQRTVVNDADRLRKYLARFGLDWAGVRRLLPGGAPGPA